MKKNVTGVGDGTASLHYHGIHRVLLEVAMPLALLTTRYTQANLKSRSDTMEVLMSEVVTRRENQHKSLQAELLSNTYA